MLTLHLTVFYAPITIHYIEIILKQQQFGQVYFYIVWVSLTYTKTKFTLQTSFVAKVLSIWLYFEWMSSHQTQTHLFSCFIYLLSFCRNCGALDVCYDRLYVTTCSSLTVSKSQFNNHVIMTYYLCYGITLCEYVIIFAT